VVFNKNLPYKKQSSGVAMLQQCYILLKMNNPSRKTYEKNKQNHFQCYYL